MMIERDGATPMTLSERIDHAEEALAVIEDRRGYVTDRDIFTVSARWTVDNMDDYDPDTDPFGIGVPDYMAVRKGLYARATRIE